MRLQRLGWGLALLLAASLAASADTYDGRTLVRIDLPKVSQRDLVAASRLDVVGAGPDWVKALLTPEELALLRAQGFAVEVLVEEMARDRELFATPGYCTNTPWPCYWAASKFDAVAPAAGTLMRHLLDLHLAHPDITRLYDIGDSQDGAYDILAMKVSKNPDADEAEPEIRLYGNIHGDEVCGLMVACDALDWILANYGTDPTAQRLVDGAELWFVPMGNPYGNANQTRYNATGTDLNRDFWSPAYPADPAFTQKETQALRDLTAAPPHRKRFATSLAFHGGATCFNAIYNYTTAPTPDEPIFFSSRTGGPDNPDCGSLCATPAPDGLAEAFADGCTMPGFWFTNGGDWYVTEGDINDWSYGAWGQLDTTVEVTETKWPDSSEIPTYTAQYRQAVLNYMVKTFQGISGAMTDAVCGTPLDGTVTAVCTASSAIPVPHAYREVLTDPEAGDFHRVLQPGTYTVTCRAPGYTDTVVEGLVVTADATTACPCPMVNAVCSTNPCSADVTPDGPLALCAGSTVALNCATEGGSGLTYQWYDGGSAIPGATGATFVAATEGTHEYTCVVSGAGCASGVTDPAATAVTWQDSPTFAGIASVTNAQGVACTLDLAWGAASSACPGTVTYSVYRSTATPVAAAPENLLATGLVATGYADAHDLTSGVRYYYLVRAVDGLGREDANAVEGSGVPTGTLSPSALFSESFDGTAFPPPGWAKQDVSGSTGDWARSTATVHPAGTPPHGGAGLAYFNSYTAASGRSTRLYRSTPTLIPSSVTTATLTFWMYHDAGDTASDRIQVQVSADGSVWVGVGAAVSRYDGSTGWKQHAISLDGYIGQSVYTGLLGISASGNDCHVDDIALGTVTASACSTVLPRPDETAPGYSLPTAQIWTDGATHAWPVNPQASLGYKVLRGGVADLPGLLDSAPDSCVAWAGAQTACALAGVPAPGSFFWYLVIAVNASGDGHAGYATSGARTPDGTDPCP